MNRRFFLLAVPAIVAAPSLMRVSTLFVPKPRIVSVNCIVDDLEVIKGRYIEGAWSEEIARIEAEVIEALGVRSARTLETDILRSEALFAWLVRARLEVT